MTDTYTLNRKKALLIVLIFFLISICIRLPNLFRPFSRHHESIPALELVSIESWQQSGGAASTHYIPLFNYQNPGDKRNPDNATTDINGNFTYISYGTGWNVLPYFYFKLLHIKATAVALRTLNILLSGFSCFFLFGLLSMNRNNYTAAVLACLVFIFTPGILWYTGNVYVNCGVAIPFILAFLFVITGMIAKPKTINTVNCCILFLLIVCLMTIDWIAVYLAFTSTIVLLLKIRNKKLFAYPVIAVSLGVVAGISMVLWQFASFLGWPMVKNNLTFKFRQRSVPQDDTFLTDAVSIMTHFITASAPLIILLIALVIKARMQKKVITLDTNIKWALAILLPALLLYNITFLSWTAVHEFSILYYSVCFAMLAGTFLQQLFSMYKLRIILAAFITITVLEYYSINPPGKKNTDGEPYDAYQKLGETIAEKSTPDQAIFTNLKLIPPATYYAKRFIDYAGTAADAKKQLLNRCLVNEAIWFDTKDLQVVHIEYLHK